MDARCDVDTIALKDPVVVDNVFYIYADAKTQRERYFESSLPRTARWTSVSQRTAFTALPNSTRTASPATSATRPPCRSMSGSITSVRSTFQRRSVDIIRGNEPRETGNISESDRREPAIDT